MKNKKLKFSNISDSLSVIKINYSPIVVKPKETKILEVKPKDSLLYVKEFFKIEEVKEVNKEDKNNKENKEVNKEDKNNKENKKVNKEDKNNKENKEVNKEDKNNKEDKEVKNFETKNKRKTSTGE